MIDTAADFARLVTFAAFTAWAIACGYRLHIEPGARWCIIVDGARGGAPYEAWSEKAAIKSGMLQARHGITDHD